MNESDYFLIFVNLVPVWGVWFEGWNPKEIFLVYCLESVLIGVFNVFRMFMTTMVKKKDEWQNKSGSVVMMSGFFFIFFFIMHYGLFLFIQMSIFLGIAGIKGANQPGGAFDFVFNFQKYLSGYAVWLLVSFAVSYAFQTIKDFIWNGAYRTASIGVLMFEPYVRVFVQQFAVILGAIFIMLGAGKIFILLFAIIKTFFEVMLDFGSMMKKGLEEKPKEN